MAGLYPPATVVCRTGEDSEPGGPLLAVVVLW